MSSCQWTGKGNGRVEVVSDSDGLRFYESGTFNLRDRSASVAFTNVYRWQPLEDRIQLYHERRGSDQAVWLLDLIPGDDENTLVSAIPHLCGDDHYAARLTLDAQGFTLCWTIRGPRKEEYLAYRYQ
ncbi:hypothetical protein GCM10008094_25970 [Aidingimonas halophila]|nr:hypothetical protein GCM10008094_25970 [Aidingimonas halophila]